MTVLMVIFVLSMSRYSNQLKDHPPLSSYRHPSQCPLWFYLNYSTGDCQCLPFLTCDERKAYIEEKYLLTVQQNQSLISTCYSKSYKHYHGNNKTKPGYRLLPKNISDLNDFMCEPLNRKGYLCGDCFDGFGPSMSVIEYPYQCYRCTDNWRGVLLYLVITLLPITIFYLIMLIFRIKMTSAPMPCFIMYSQLVNVCLCFSLHWSFEKMYPIFYSESGDIKAVTILIFALYGIFNLNFISNVVPSFCVNNKITLYHLSILGYINVFYPMLLILMTWVCIELHDRNCRVIVYLWRPFHRCFVRLRRGWDTKNDLIDVFATFLLLSYVKIIYQSVLFTSLTKITTYSLNGDFLLAYHVSDIDMTVKRTSTKYGAAFAVLLNIVFNILPVLLLVLYPFRLFRKMLSKLQLDGISLMIFVERFHCCYRDGLDGKRDMRYFSGIYFFLCFFLFCCPSLLHFSIFKLDMWFTRGTILFITVLIISLCKPYKKFYMNVCDTLLLFHLAMICFILSSDVNNMYFVPLMQIMLLLPFAVLVLVICFKFAYKTHCALFIMSLYHSFITHLRALRTTALAGELIFRNRNMHHQLTTYGTV